MADIWNIGGALLGGLLGGQDSKTSQTTTNNPYAPAQPWINANIGSGQRLQNFYQANPLSPGQIGAFANSFAGTQGYRDTANSLLGQMSNAQTFDRTNPLARPAMFNFQTPQQTTAGGGLLAGYSNPFGASPAQAQAAQAAYFGPSAYSGGGGINPRGEGMSQQSAGVGMSGSDLAKNIADISRMIGYVSPVTGLLGGLLSDQVAKNTDANYSHEGRNYGGGSDGGGVATGGREGSDGGRDASGGGDRGTRGGW